ncbi:MAG: hypothetical protein H8E79_06520 [Desulfobulbaceae bacterium]|uniref:Conjugal transfer protein TraB n=1 Tax=Candidatus Desulfatifera sulfidica TaxID=2841691 RepID=A0A8J6NB31_9BACT|nr:hypothetical protein [Candidatus Desulfatifera sulfidica]
MSKHETQSSQTPTISDETLLKISKEIAIKFIEVGRITPTTFNETFPQIHNTIKETILKR